MGASPVAVGTHWDLVKCVGCCWNRWRLTEWLKFDYKKGMSIFFDNNTLVELFDHQGGAENDFNAYENVNVASDKAYADIITSLKVDLRWHHRPVLESQTLASFEEVCRRACKFVMLFQCREFVWPSD